MNNQNLMICGEVGNNEKVDADIPYHLGFEGRKVIAQSFFSDAKIRNICFNTDRAFIQKLAQEKADLRVVRQKGSAVAFRLSNLRPEVKPQVTSWNA